jgi:hypothetical protein
MIVLVRTIVVSTILTIYIYIYKEAGLKILTGTRIQIKPGV